MKQAQLNNRYAALLAQANVTTSRKDAIYLIREADKVRMLMASHSQTD